MKKLVLIALLSIPYFNTYTITGNQAFPAMSEAELRALEEELSRMTPEEQQAFYQITNEIKQIEEAVQKMSPEEQKIFQETMEKLSQLPESELERMISGQMSEEEMDALFTNLFADQQPQDSSFEPEKPEQKEEAPAEPAASGKYNEIILLIDAIINKSESFLLKMSSFPDISGKILSWSKKGLLNEWATSSWNAIRADIEALVQKLKKAKEFSSDKKTYLYLQDIMENEPLVNTLKLIRDALNECENCLEIAPFGLEKISASSKKIIQRILNRFAHAIKKGNLIKDLDILFSKQDSAEKKAKPSELQQPRSPQAPKPTPIVGDDSFLSPYEEFPYPSYDYNEPYTSRSPEATLPTASMPSTVRAPEPITEPKQVKRTDSNTKNSASSSITQNTTQHQDQQRRSSGVNQQKVNESVTAFDKNLKDAATAIEQSTVLSSFKKHLTSKESVDLPTANEYLPTAVKKLNTALDAIKIDMPGLSVEDKKQYKKKLTDTFAKYEKSFDAVMQEWNDIESNWEVLESTISADKLYAYVGSTEEKESDMPIKKASRSKRNPSSLITQKVINPSSYAQLSNDIKEIKEKITNL